MSSMMRALQLLSAVLCYFSFLLYSINGFHVIYEENGIAEYDSKMLHFFHAPQFGLGSLDDNGEAIIYVNLPEGLIDRLFLICLNFSRHNVDIEKYLQQPFFSSRKSSSVKTFLEYYNTRLPWIQQGILDSEYDVSEGLTDNQIIQDLDQAIDVVNSVHFKLTLPVVMEESLVLSENKIGVGATTVVFLVEGSEEVKNYKQDEIAKIEPGSVVFKIMTHPFKKSQMTRSYYQLDLSEIQYSFFLHSIDRITRYLSLVTDYDGKCTGYLIESAQLDDGQKFLHRHRNIVLSDDYYFLNEMYELALTIDKLHKAGLVHTDIKENNILVFKKDPKSTEINGNYLFKLADLGSVDPINTRCQSERKPNEEKRYWIPPEMYDNRLIKYTGRPTVDWYQFGYLLLMFSRTLCGRINTNWLYHIFAPLISALTVQNPNVRFGANLIKDYFSLILNQEHQQSISRSEIITTCVVKMPNGVLLQLQQNEEHLKKIVEVKCNDFFHFFVRSKLDEIETIHAEFKVEVQSGSFLAVSKTLTSKAIHPYKSASFQDKITVGIRSNMNFFQTHYYIPGDVLRLDTNWGQVVIHFDNESTDIWHYVNDLNEFSDICNLAVDKLEYDKKVEAEELANLNRLSHMNMSDKLNSAVLSLSFQQNEPKHKKKGRKPLKVGSAMNEPIEPLIMKKVKPNAPSSQ